ncbi:hypothetical protein HPB48_007915 [Haemaphysalis longicornis]|uniref:Riboflavin transporter n=1 Tax=Haemaphysalis longicornis TaxID=44386 RepID=A0A9J6FYZ0_HAELO|nr:hypothetical protein HPB48_007915 [Haemaphysalis longicornis]
MEDPHGTGKQPSSQGRRDPSGWARAVISACSLLFGVSAWVSVNGLWVQMPLLVPSLPEGWNLGSLLVIVIQVANVGPLAYTLARNRLGILSSVHATLFVGLTSSVLLVFLWRKTVGDHSVAFIALAFFMSLVDCTSSVLYMPFMARYPPQFLFWYMVGEGLSGLLPAAIALVQGVGSSGGGNATALPGNGSSLALNSSGIAEDDAAAAPTLDPSSRSGPRFSVEVFLSLLCIILAISWLAFSALAHWPLATAYQVPDKRGQKGRRMAAILERCLLSSSLIKMATPITPTRRRQSSVNSASGEDSTLSAQRQNRLKRWQWWLALFLQGTIACLGNGVLLAIQTYSSLPYGQVPYHLATNLAVIANPIACAVASVVPLKSLTGLVSLTAAGLVCAAYILTLALESPTPVLVGTLAGAALMVTAWVMFVFLTTFVKSRLAAGLMAHGGARSLLWYGVATQGGSFVGALVMFMLTTYTNVFVSS